MKKRRKPSKGSSTDYAYQNKETTLWYTLGDVVHEQSSYHGTSLAQAWKMPLRYDVDEKLVRVVSGRFVPLSTKVARSKKRTR